MGCFMKLDKNFSNYEYLEKIINYYQPLADWFERNQDLIVYLELTKKEYCLIYENNQFISNDIKMLGKMTYICFCSLELPFPISPEEKAKFIALSMAKVYEEEKGKLDDNAKVNFYLNINELQKENKVEKNTYTLSKNMKIRFNKN